MTLSKAGNSATTTCAFVFFGSRPPTASASQGTVQPSRGVDVDNFTSLSSEPDSPVHWDIRPQSIFSPPHDGRWGALSNSSRDTWLRSFAQSGLVADSRAFAIIEVVLVAAIIAIIAAIAIPTLQAAVDTVKQARGIMEIKGLQTDIIRHEILRGSLPNALTELGRADLTDPWGSTYQYALHSSVPPGQRRQDQFLVPINSRYDLYSMGKDKASVPALTAAPSQDDIIIAADGGYVGLASGF